MVLDSLASSRMAEVGEEVVMFLTSRHSFQIVFSSGAPMLDA